MRHPLFIFWPANCVLSVVNAVDHPGSRVAWVCSALGWFVATAHALSRGRG